MAQQKSQLTPEMLVPKIGDALLRGGHISEKDLQKALAYQQEQIAQHKTYLLGQALVDLKLIERATLDEAVTEQIIQLRSALQAANRNLELRVQERTRELQEALQRLSELSQMKANFVANEICLHLTQLAQTKANFVANVSHELRTPLT